ncbi:MAG: radical SAM protein [Myxococcota bacterium]
MALSKRQQTIDARLERETGTLHGRGRRAVALVYPSPYRVGMASLGFQTVYRILNHLPDTAAERAFLPDDGDGFENVSGPLLTYETCRPVSDFGVVAFSVAYELELSGLLTCLKLAGIAPRRADRAPSDPWVIAGGPLTFSNPAPLAPFCDVVVMGEAEQLLEPLIDALHGGSTRAETLRELASCPGYYVPSEHVAEIPAIARCDDEELPAASCIWTEESVLPNMFLVETERGCSRGCTFCVMRRTTNGGMRIVPVDRVLAAIPDEAPRVGLVGAAVSDHPGLIDIVRGVVDAGREIGLSSLRSDRMTPELVELLVRGGARTLTVASDGASERLRRSLEKKIRERHLLAAAKLAGDAGIRHLKVYSMIGVPDETDDDLDELIRFTLLQAEAAGPRTKIAISLSPFVAKRNTPLDGAPFVGIREAERRIDKLRRGLQPRVDVSPVSARWAWVEYALAQGGPDTGLAAYDAWQEGGSFAAWKRALAKLGVTPDST